MSDPSQAASDPELSAWVAANAGAGKTYTLANRVTRLLLADANPQRILCLTFTKAAAAEMQHRLFKQLGKWSMLPDGELREEIEKIGARADNLPKARQLFAQALETPGGLKVLTIHAFCQIVLSRFPIEAGVPPGFDVMDEQTARVLIQEARASALERAGSGDALLAPALAHLVAQVSEASLTNILNAALSNDRRKLDRFFALTGEAGLAEHIWRSHGAARGEDAGGDFCAALKRDRKTLEEIRDWLNSGGKTDIGHGGKIAAFLALDFSPESFDVLRGYLLTGSGESRAKLASNDLTAKSPRVARLSRPIAAAMPGCPGTPPRRPRRRAGRGRPDPDPGRAPRLYPGQAAPWRAGL